ncbi:MAG: dTMP kinase [Nitriliruptorales bacterium]|nr:dTMP kinase [Nitriliruptorales bacterium]
MDGETVDDGRSGGADQDLAPGLGAEGREAYSDLLKNGDFRNLFFAMLTSSLGDWIGVLAILTLTDDILGGTRAAAFGVSVVMIARIVPTLVLGPVAGVYVDRWDRKRTMIATDIGRGAVMVLLAFAGDIWALILATLVIEVMSTLFIPAKDSALPNLVAERRLVHANQLSLGATYGTFPLGGVVNAVLIGVATTYLATTWAFLQDRPVALPIWFNAATFFVSAVFIARIRSIPVNGRRDDRRNGPSEAASADRPSAWQELKEGFRFIADQPLVRALVVGVMAAFLAAGGVIATGEFFVGVVNAGDSGFGVLVAVLGSGLFLGLVGVAPLARRIDKERLFAPGIGVAGVALVVAALMPRLDLASIPAFVMGVGAGVSFISGYTLLQEKTDDDIRGRTFAAFNTGVRMALFVSLILAPALVGVIGREGAGVAGPTPYTVGGVRITLILAGLVALAGAVWSGRSIYEVLTRDQAAGRPSTRELLPGTFVVFEGGDGAGKSTQIGLLRGALEEAGYDVVTTREPGGTEVGERVRDLLLDHGSAGLTDRTEALLYAAARAQHAEEVIRPALEKGAVVLSDRYVDSSVVYQGGARQLGEEKIEELNRWGTKRLEPDLVVLLDIDPEEGLARAGGEAPDRLESAGLAFHRAVNDAFRRRARSEPDRYLVVDASRPAEDLHAEIREVVLERLEVTEEPPT